MAEEYINRYYNNIQKYSNIIDNRVCDDNLGIETLIKENKYNRKREVIIQKYL